jgi:integrase
MTSKVTLRRKPITKGRESLYLEFYPPIRDKETMKMTYKEYLGIYIYQNPQNQIQRDYNNEVLIKAEGIRSIRVQSIINEEFGFLDKNKWKSDFLAYFLAIAKTKDHKWLFVYKHFEKFVAGKCSFGDISVELCRKFRNYLLNTKQLKRKKVKMNQNSVAGYFSTFRALLKIAYRDKMIRENINDFLDKVEYQDTKKEYLTKEELGKLAVTPCEIPVLKAASLFSCLTGLRISDILKLEWREIEPASDGGYCMRIRTEKTETETTLPISDEALSLCGERRTGKVFKNLQRSMVYQPLKQWIKHAGIEKHITFHCFRHTFATLQIAMGTDIFTVSKMLTHKNVSTTQIYAELVNEKKRESANKISLKELILKVD